ncbi:MAG TPA: hypothetical protein GXZ98_09190 [Firmicutes bacterium]|jgi:hypothetical protein|nr:hypothetical protein [Bacillota bacterium]
MVRKNFTLLAVLLVTSFFLSGGCLRKPYFPGQDLGTLRLRIKEAENTQTQQEFSLLAKSNELEKLEIILTNKEYLKKKEIQPYLGEHVVTFDSLYPGTWKIQVNGYDREDDVIFYGEDTRSIPPGKTVEASLMIKPAPGWVMVTVDLALLQAEGYTVTSGKFYVYKDPSNNRSTSFDLHLEGNYLKNSKEIKLAEGTYETDIYIPQKTGAIYGCHYGLIQIRSGKETAIHLDSDAGLIIDAVIDANPATPENFSGTLIGDQVYLSWDPVFESDLVLYNIYRSNKEGVLKLHDQVDKDTHSFTEVVSPGDFGNGCLKYAVSSLDWSGNNSIWTEPVVFYLAESSSPLN